jgi:hypothetical protein
MAKSFSIKLGADTTEFIKEMQKVDKQINSTQKSAQNLEKSLELEYDSSRAVQAQKQFQKALELTEEKSKKIREQLKLLEESGRIDSEDYSRLQLELAKSDAQAVKLKQSLEDIKNVKVEQIADKFKDVGEGIEAAGKKLSVFSAAAAGAIAGAVKLAKDAVETGDEIATLADKYDMSTKAIQRWQYVAMQTDVEMDTLLKSMQKAQSAFAEQAAGGTNAAVKALEALGLSFKDFDSGEEAFEALIARLSAVDDRTLQVAYTTDILGDRFAANLIPMLKAGKDAIMQYTAEFESVGYLSEETVNQLASLDNEVNKVTAQFELAKTELGVSMIPIYEKLVDVLQNYVIPALQKLSDWFDNLSPSSQNAIMGFLGVIAAAAPLLILIGKISTGVGSLINFFSKLNKQSLVTAAGVAALGAALGLSLDLISNWKNMSTIEKILKSLAVAALVAAAAVTVFHASWSLGIAIGAITAGIVAGIAAIKAASEDIGVDAGLDANGIPTSATENAMTEQDMADINSWTKAANAGSSSVVNNSQVTEDNSVNNYYITIESNEYMNEEQIVEAISRKIATLSQARR